MNLTFLGAAGTVTGSKYLVNREGHQVLVDCGLFQGYKHLRKMNWEAFSFDPVGLDAVVLSHAHLDHSGALPLLIRRGFRGLIFATRGTIDLCQILLPDSGRLQQEEADYLNRHHGSKRKPAHADAAPLGQWMGSASRAPRKVFLTHGEPGPADTLRQRIQTALGWNASVARMGQTVELTA